MNFNKHYELIGKHAVLGASTWRWINDQSVEATMNRYCKAYVQTIGTAIHEFAARQIEASLKMTGDNGDRNALIIKLLDAGVPFFAIDPDVYMKNLVLYVNDAIAFGMTPEQPLQYSDIFFGTADAISYNEKNKILRIHDLKTGAGDVHMEQLLIYAALFCLEYKIKPIDISIELRIYWKNDILVMNPTTADLSPVIDKMICFNKYASDIIRKKGKK